MRILHVSEVHWGGVVGLIHHFNREQAAVGHDVHLLCPPAFPATSHVTRYAWRLHRRRPVTIVTALYGLFRTVRRVRPDVVHLHSFMAGLLGRLPGVIPSGTPVVYQPHAWSFELFPDRVRASAVRRWEGLAARRTSVLVGNNADELAEGKAIGVHRPGFSLGVALDLEHFRPPSAEERAAAREEHGRGGRRILLVLGRLGRQKGQELLLPEWERDPVPDTDLVLVGPGDGAALRALAPTQWSRSVHAVGESNDVRSWLWASDVLLLPSRYEGGPLVVPEAMACGVPVVATAVNGSAEAVLGGPLPTAGAVVDRGDMPALLGHARMRLADRELAAREARNGRRRAEELFDPRVVGARLEAAYRVAGAAPAESGSSR